MSEDILNQIAEAQVRCTYEGDYDPADDYIQDPFCREMHELLARVYDEISRLRAASDLLAESNQQHAATVADLRQHLDAAKAENEGLHAVAVQCEAEAGAMAVTNRDYAAEIERLRAFAEPVPEGCVRFPDGTTRKVLGVLQITDDGCVIGDTGTVWLISDNYRDGVVVYSVNAHLDLYEPNRGERFADPVAAAEKMKEILAARSKKTDAAGGVA